MTPKIIDDNTDEEILNYESLPNTWKSKLESYIQIGKFLGKHPGKKVCICNLGWAFDEDTVKKDLRRYLKGVESIDFASFKIDNVRACTGYGCINFDSTQNAVDGLIKIYGLYLDSPYSPILRPILAHFPMWEIYPWGGGENPGYLQYDVPSHFIQPNSIEYSSGIEWRLLQQQLAVTKMDLCESIVLELIEMIKDHKFLPINDKYFSPMKDYTSLPYLYLKGIRRSMTNEKLTEIFREFDEQASAYQPKCPISNRDYGHGIVHFSSVEKSKNVAIDMETVLYSISSPRPLEVYEFRPGPPLGFESVFDTVIKKVFGLDAAKILEKYFGECRVVMKNRDSTLDKEVAGEKVRAILEGFLYHRYAYKMEATERRKALHKEQNEEYKDELEKNKYLHEILDNPTVKKLYYDNNIVLQYD